MVHGSSPVFDKRAKSAKHCQWVMVPAFHGATAFVPPHHPLTRSFIEHLHLIDHLPGLEPQLQLRLRRIS
jgi:hypothetical protein